jgi:hypothetical protein
VQVSQGLDVEVVSHQYERMRRKKETNLNGDPTVETRIFTNNRQADDGESRKKKLRLSRGERKS